MNHQGVRLMSTPLYGCVLLLLLLLGLKPSDAQTTAFTQPPGYPNNGGTNAWHSTFDPVTSRFYWQTLDAFRVPNAQTVAGLTWQGLLTDVNRNGGPTAIPLQGFRIYIYDDRAGQPDRLVFSDYIPGNANQKSAGMLNFFGGGVVSVNNHSARLNTPFNAAGATTYWLSIVGVADAPAFWAWARGNYGDGRCWQDRPFGGGRFLRTDGDRAFSLQVAPKDSNLVFNQTAGFPNNGPTDLPPKI